MEERHKEINGSLCWLCRKVGIECEKPVKGWDADYKPLRSFEGGNDIPSWFVRDCPEFIPDRVEYENIRPSEKEFGHKPQGRDPSTLKRYKIFGESLTTDELCERYNITRAAFRARLRRGSTPEEAVSRAVGVSRAKRYDIFGESLTVSEISKKYNIKERTFRQRICRGMNPEDAVLTGKKNSYILIGSCIETGEIRQWFDVNEACESGLGFNRPGISSSVKHGMVHKGWIFERKTI